MHQAKTAGRGLQPRPKRLFSGVGKYFGRGCKPRPADRQRKTRVFCLFSPHIFMTGGEKPGFFMSVSYMKSL
ncbi:Uncharacterized protein dnm_003020 [Desulfonema magnum]|uniref:Uncharacterized protein n=1 Tax=Desulfonema magnum TaxID=45655 RepID=A0A975BFE4_9BACT|nr:Uncharacterized protein dnm_003020 [Desulfonema magnum]